jgi:eukaryotic-like serine/threonine-protein kinase
MASEQARAASNGAVDGADRADATAERDPLTPVPLGGVIAGKYRIERVVGYGGMGIVCEATHLELGTKVAVKFVRQEHAADEKAVGRFLTEARSAAQLKSEHTCRVVDCGQLESGGPYMVMEYLEGADLRAIVSEQGAFSIEEAVSFTLQACIALAEAHARHLVHRDIKPENLFLTQRPDGTGLIKVLDFGISKQLGRGRVSRDLTAPSESIGSPFHMSPEQMIDPSQVDPRTDIWSIGVVVYELLTGRLPFNGDATPQICANVMTATPLSPRDVRPELPEGLSNVVMTCLAKNREQRYPDVGALSRALEAFASSDQRTSASRIERILDRTRAGHSSRAALSGAVARVPSLAEEPLPLHIPGLPRKRPLLRAVLLVLLSTLAGLGYAKWQERLRTEELRSAAEPAPPAVAASTVVPETIVTARTPKKIEPKKPKHPTVSASAEPVSSDEPPALAPKELPPASSSNLYPELKAPELPPP